MLKLRVMLTLLVVLQQCVGKGGRGVEGRFQAYPQTAGHGFQLAGLVLRHVEDFASAVAGVGAAESSSAATTATVGRTGGY